MKRVFAFAVLTGSLLAGAAASFAQGPPPGGPPPGGPRFGGERGLMMGRGMGHAVVTGHPYSGTETTTTVQTLAGGNTITHQNVAQVYRDSSGRVRIDRTVTPPPGSNQSSFTETTILDPVAGFRYQLNSATLTARQTPLPKPKTQSSSTTTPPAPPQRPGFTMTTNDLGTSSVNGVSATGKQVTETIAPGTIGNAETMTVTRTSWISTDLQVPVSIKSSDPRFGNVDVELTNISMAEPAATLFQIPSNYTIKQGGGPGGPFGRGPGGSFRHHTQQ